MNPGIQHSKLAQEILNQHGAALVVDGDFGRRSDAAADRLNGINLPAKRQIALTIQREWNRTHTPAIKEDGWWGPVTADIAERLLGTDRPERPDELPEQCWDGTCSAVRCWSPSEAAMTRHYGEPGTGQTTVATPYAMRLDWDRSQVVTRTTLHRLAAPSWQAAMEETRDHYGREKIEALGLHLYGGSLNVRKKRGGNTWSTHAWGAASDFSPGANQLRQNHLTAGFARPEYAAWFQIWERHGWMSLGRCFDFDWMHLQRNPQ